MNKDSTVSLAIDLAERGLMPDAGIRHGIRRLLKARLREQRAQSVEERIARFETFRDSCQQGPIAIETPAANQQHYEVPTAFFERVLGPRLKYSSCLFAAPDTTLADAENAMLALADERADLHDGQAILELGCGWGSWSLWMAERYPRSSILAVSNSRTQKEFIDAQATARGLTNLQVVTRDINDFDPGRQFDRVVSVEMFEHLRNHRELLRRIRTWLRSDGRLFVHIFCHREFAYPFETDGDDNWMGRHFFTGGIMPSFDWLAYCSDDFGIDRQWAVNGTHYSRTLEAWLALLDRQRQELAGLFASPVGLQRWRIFLMACSELFGFAGGNEWFVGHFRLTPR